MLSSHLEFCVPSSERHLPELRRRLRTFCREIQGASFDARELSDLELALQEACVNAIRHARSGSSAPVLDVSFAAGGGQLTIEVRENETYRMNMSVDAEGTADQLEGFGFMFLGAGVSTGGGEDISYSALEALFNRSELLEEGEDSSGGYYLVERIPVDTSCVVMCAISTTTPGL